MQPRKILARDGIHAVLMGFTMEEWTAIMIGGLGMLLLGRKVYEIAMVDGVIVFVIRNVLRKYPDHYVVSVCQFFLRDAYHYVASRADTALPPYLKRPT